MAFEVRERPVRTEFFAIPRGQYDRAAGHPAGMREVAEPAGGLEQRDRSAAAPGADTVDPSVALRTEDQLLARDAAVQNADRVPQRGGLANHLDDHVDRDRAPRKGVGDGHAAGPTGGVPMGP